MPLPLSLYAQTPGSEARTIGISWAVYFNLISSLVRLEKDTGDRPEIALYALISIGLPTNDIARITTSIFLLTGNVTER